LLVHIGDPSSNQATTLESQMTHTIQELFGQTLSKFPQADHLLSADTLNRYVHSPNFAPSPDHLRALWDWMADYLVHCLNA
jgi:hypothetical protein